MPFDPNEYVRRILATRRLHIALDREADRELRRLLRQSAGELARIIQNMPPGTVRERQVFMRRQVERLYERLRRQMLATTEDGVRTQFVAIKDAMDEITMDALRSEPGVRVTFVPRPPAQQAAAFLARGGTAEAFRTLDRTVRGASTAVDDLIAQAIATNMNPETLARRLRPFVLGQRQFTPEELRDFRTIPKSRRDDARLLRMRTRRIAITEMGNAAHEAQVQNMQEAPMTRATRWRLSPVRGTQQGIPDECDILATQDLYGLGKGIFPTIKIPIRPHPNDRCWLQSVTRPPDAWGDAKPTPALQTRPDGSQLLGITPLAQLRAEQSAMRAILAGAGAERAA